MYRRLIPTLVAAGLLVFGIGAAGAIADDNQPAAPPTGCTIAAPNQSEQDAADAVANAADDVNQEAQNQQGDDEQGDQQNNQSGEQGDCNDQNDGEQGND